MHQRRPFLTFLAAILITAVQTLILDADTASAQGAEPSVATAAQSSAVSSNA